MELRNPGLRILPTVGRKPKKRLTYILENGNRKNEIKEGYENIMHELKCFYSEMVNKETLTMAIDD